MALASHFDWAGRLTSPSTMHQWGTRVKLGSESAVSAGSAGSSHQSRAELQSEIKITKTIGEMTFGEGFCKCCQPQIHCV